MSLIEKSYALIEKYYGDNPPLKNIYITHVEMVRDKALKVAEHVAHLNPNLEFIAEASLLHDIGIFKTNCPEIFCHGTADYIEHGYLGREILDAEGLPLHGLVAERHTGSGITKQEIIDQKLPLPVRDMLPLSLEEKIVCYADCFYSKNPARLREEKSPEAVRASLLKFGEACAARFDELHKLLG